MKRIKVLLAGLILLPLLALGANLDPAEGVAVAQSESARVSGQESVTCCWIFFMGRWICVPC